MEWILVIVVGFLAGVINTMAAGGSLITLPVLIFLGLPSAVANGTNRVALVIQSITATTNFYHKGYVDKDLGLLLSIPALIGAIFGANMAITISDRLFHIVLAMMMIITVIFIVWKPTIKGKELAAPTYSLKQKIGGVIAFFVIGFYGGFIQAGAGFFILATLAAIFGLPLLKSNVIKVYVTGIYIFVSLIVFILHDQVNWTLGLSLALGNALGAWVGSQLTISKGEKWIKVLLVISVIAMATKLILKH